MTEEQKEKISKKMTGLRRSEATKARMSRAKTGKPHTQAHNQAIADGLKRYHCDNDITEK